MKTDGLGEKFEADYMMPRVRHELAWSQVVELEDGSLEFTKWDPKPHTKVNRIKHIFGIMSPMYPVRGIGTQKPMPLGTLNFKPRRTRTRFFI